MKKKSIKKLLLHKTTVSNLDPRQQQRVRGGETFLDCVTNISLCTCGPSCDASCFGLCPTQGDTCYTCAVSCVLTECYCPSDRPRTCPSNDLECWL
jgi:hypothetical protein